MTEQVAPVVLELEAVMLCRLRPRAYGALETEPRWGVLVRGELLMDAGGLGRRFASKALALHEGRRIIADSGTGGDVVG